MQKKMGGPFIVLILISSLNWKIFEWKKVVIVSEFHNLNVFVDDLGLKITILGVTNSSSSRDYVVVAYILRNQKLFSWQMVGFTKLRIGLINNSTNLSSTYEVFTSQWERKLERCHTYTRHYLKYFFHTLTKYRATATCYHDFEHIPLTSRTLLVHLSVSWPTTIKTFLYHICTFCTICVTVILYDPLFTILMYSWLCIARSENQ